MKLSLSERRSLWLHYEILKAVNPDELVYYQDIQEILLCGFPPPPGSTLPHMSEDEITEEDADLVRNTLDMFTAIKQYRKKSGETLEGFMSTFIGFGGNDETRLMAYTRFLIENQKKWGSLEITEFNSHLPVASTYARMTQVWQSAGQERFALTKEWVAKIRAASVEID